MELGRSLGWGGVGGLLSEVIKLRFQAGSETILSLCNQILSQTLYMHVCGPPTYNIPRPIGVMVTNDWTIFGIGRHFSRS